MKKNGLIIIVILGVIVIAFTYFIFTTTTSQPTTLKLFEPRGTETKENGIPDSTDPNKVLSLVLDENDKIFYYTGMFQQDQVKQTSYQEIRTILQQKKKEFGDSGILVLIKPAKAASYKNTIDMLDEMAINNIKRYAMVDVSDADQKIADSYK